MFDLKSNSKQLWEPFSPSPQQPWSNRLAAHLLRRSGFGNRIEDTIETREMGIEAAIEQLFNYDAAKRFDQEMEAAGKLVTTGSDSHNLAAWWLLRMTKTPCPLIEKMTLFWHGHFATGADKVTDARAMLRQNNLIREHCLGKFEPLVTQLSRDVAMLIYLDSTENRKTRPNENYARELMELFCLGPGNYTEQDIKQIARCFTGWEVHHDRFKFNKYQHDEGEKSYLGVRGNHDGDDAIRVILQQPAAARFIARKLIRFFGFDDRPITDEFAEPLAENLRNSDFDIPTALKMIFRSHWFYSDLAVGQKIKSPVELAVGALRLFGASVNMQNLAKRLKRLGQLPLYPPNVKGWDGGRTWINASTILARANLVEEILNNKQTKFQAGSLDQWFERNRTHLETETDGVNEFLLAQPIDRDTRKTLQDLLRTEPRRFLPCLVAIPEFQLA